MRTNGLNLTFERGLPALGGRGETQAMIGLSATLGVTAVAGSACIAFHGGAFGPGGLSHDDRPHRLRHRSALRNQDIHLPQIRDALIAYCFFCDIPRSPSGSNAYFS